MRAIPTWLRFVGWMIGIPFVLGGVGGLFSGDYLSGTLTVVLGASFIPQTRVYIYNQAGLDPSLGVRIVFRLGIIILMVASSPAPTESQKDDVASESPISSSSNRNQSITDSITRTVPSVDLMDTSTTRFGLTLEQRKEYYVESYDISQRSRIEIQRRYPDWKLLVGGASRQMEYEHTLREGYENELRQRYNITAEQASRIDLEGIENMWSTPPNRPDPDPVLQLDTRYTLHGNAKLHIPSLQRTLLDGEWFTPVAFQSVLGSDGYLVNTPYGEGWFNKDQIGRLYGKLTRIGVE